MGNLKDAGTASMLDHMLLLDSGTHITRKVLLRIAGNGLITVIIIGIIIRDRNLDTWNLTTFPSNRSV